MNNFKNINSVNFMVHTHNNDYVEPHNHVCFEFLIMQSGTIEHITENTKETIIQGDVLLFCPGITHSYTTPKISSLREIIITPAFFKECCDNILSGLFENIVNSKYIKTHCSNEWIASVENNIYSYQENTNIKVKNAFKSIIVSNLIGFLLPSKHDNGLKSSFKDNCLRAMNKYYALPDALSLIRNDLGYNDIYFCKKFKKCFNCTLVEYVNDLRLNHAAYLLESQKPSVSECLTHIGIDSMPYFIKIFKQKYGLTPSEYKKVHNHNY